MLLNAVMLADVAFVPPLATGNAVPEYDSVNVPLVVTGLLVTVKMLGALNPTLVTVPEPDGDAQVPSPRQNVLDDALVPPLRLATGKLPVTPVDNGKPVAFVSVTLVGVPKTGVVSVGLVDRTTLPVPVLVVTPVPPLATANVPVSVIVPDEVIGPPVVDKPVVPPATLTDVTVPALAAGVAQVPSPLQNVVLDALVPLFRLATGRLPVTPVESGKPVALVSVTLAGVPSVGVVIVGLVNVKPATVAAVAPSDTAVDPIVTDELVSPALGMVVEAVTALAPLAYI
jgi:hypothetical protein